MEITKEYVKTLTPEQKAELEKELLKSGVDPDYVAWLIYDKSYVDVVKDKD